MVREASSDIHMLSHLVGAANRADIRRLRELEAEKTVLEDKLACQQRHLTETLGAKERRIRELVALLAARDDHAGSKAAGDELLRALRCETGRRLQMERRIETLEARLAEAIQPRPSIDGHAPGKAVPVCCEHAEALPAPARAVASAGGTLLHHDGGTEMNLSLLPGLISRADRIVVALDSVSHAAAGVARRYARGCGKPLLPVPILSLTSLMRALGTT